MVGRGGRVDVRLEDSGPVKCGVGARVGSKRRKPPFLPSGFTRRGEPPNFQYRRLTPPGLSQAKTPRLVNGSAPALLAFRRESTGAGEWTSPARTKFSQIRLHGGDVSRDRRNAGFVVPYSGALATFFFTAFFLAAFLAAFFAGVFFTAFFAAFFLAALGFGSGAAGAGADVDEVDACCRLGF